MLKISIFATALVMGTVTALALAMTSPAPAERTAAAQIDTTALTVTAPALPTLAADMF